VRRHRSSCESGLPEGACRGVDGKVHTACAKADGSFISHNGAGLFDDIAITYSTVTKSCSDVLIVFAASSPGFERVSCLLLEAGIRLLLNR
jgi:hypothetical protein